MDNLWDLLFQLMKHGTKMLHVACIFLFSVEPFYFLSLCIVKGL